MRRLTGYLLGLLMLQLIAAGAANAQSGCSIFTYGSVPTPGQWNNCLQTKQDKLGFIPVNQGGATMTGRLVTQSSSTSAAGFAVTPGIAPTNPVDGDIWTTASGIFVQINGTTVGPLTATGSTIPSVLQGDLLYGSLPGTLSSLPKNTSSTRYLSNTGTSNNPAWAQVNLGNGVTGNLPVASLATGTQDTVLGYFGSTAASAAALSNCSGAITYSTSTHAFGCNTSSVFVSGTPTANQVAQWTNSSTVKGADMSALLSAGGGIALTGTTPATVSLANNSSTLSTQVTNPTITSSTSFVMMGMGSTCKITPGYSTRLRLSIGGNAYNNTSGSRGSMTGRYGTGTAPANGVAATGSSFLANSFSFQAAAADQPIPFYADGIVTGLTPGVQYWFDLGLSASSNSVYVQNVRCIAQEF